MPRRRDAGELLAASTDLRTAFPDAAIDLVCCFRSLRNGVQPVGRRSASLEEGRCPILLTERKDHLAYFAARLQKFAKHLVVLHGSMTAHGRNAAKDQLAAIPPDEERLVLATGRYIGEGFDDPRLDRLFLTLPVSWKGTLVQYTGRLHRIYGGKTEVRIYDYVARQVPMLLRMFEKRLRGYRAIGYARGEAPLGFGEASEEMVVEYDPEATDEPDTFAFS